MARSDYDYYAGLDTRKEPMRKCKACGKGDPNDTYGDDTKKPPLPRGKDDGKVMSASAASKKARSGADMGKPGKNFDSIAAKAGKEYDSKSAGTKVAGAIFQKERKAGKL